MKKRVLAIMLAAAALFAAASFFVGCDFVGTVPDYYYSYNVDLTQETGRQLYEDYNGAAVYVEVTRYENDPLIPGNYRAYKFNSSGVYVTEDGWLALPAAGFVPTSYLRSVDRYSVRVYYYEEEDGVPVQHDVREFFYEKPYVGNQPANGNIIIDEEYGVAIVKMPIEGRTNRYIPVSGNTALTSLGETLWLFSVMPESNGIQGGGLISSVQVGALGVKISGGETYDYVNTRALTEYMLDGRFHREDVGGIAVNEYGQAAGIIISRIYNDTGSDQSDDIYGKACMADISHVADLLAEAEESNAQ